MNNFIPDPADLLTPNQAAQLLGVDPASIRRWLKTGRMPGYKIGGGVRVSKVDVLAMLKPAEPDNNVPMLES